jgi:hypothetical protein
LLLLGLTVFSLCFYLFVSLYAAPALIGKKHVDIVSELYPGLKHLPRLQKEVYPLAYCYSEFSQGDCEEAEYVREKLRRRNHPVIRSWKKPLRIGVGTWTNEWLLEDIKNTNLASCPLPVQLVEAKQALDRNFDVLVCACSETSSISGVPAVLVNLEAFDHNFPDNVILGSYSRQGDVWMTSWPASFQCAEDDRLCLFPKPEKSHPKLGVEAFGAVFISDCHDLFAHRRMRFVRELALHIPLHSYGKCTIENTIPMDEHSVLESLLPDPSELLRLAKYERKLMIMKQYNFSFVLENNIKYDYVTEKYFHGVLTGNVLVNFGAPNLNSLAPFKYSAIDALDFAHPKHLAEYLKFLRANENFYEMMLLSNISSRSNAVNPEYIQSYRHGFTSSLSGENSLLCRIAQYLNGKA